MKSFKKSISVLLSVLILVFSVCVAGLVSAEPVSETAEETTTGGFLDGLEEKFEDIDLGIDGFAETERLGKILDWFISIVDSIKEFLVNLLGNLGGIFEGDFSGIMDTSAVNA